MMKKLFASFIGMLAFFIFFQNSYAQQVERVEPMFWWTGMKNPNLQVLLYGKNLADYKVSVNYPGVTFKGLSKVESKNYLFVNLIIDKKAKSGKFKIALKKGNETIDVPYELLQRAEGSAQRKGFNSADAIYLIMPDRFSNGDPSNDSQPDMADKANRQDPDGRHGGDIQGMINHLDYLKNLGVTVVWPTPLMEDNQPTTSYHGYAITNFYRIDPRYGTNEQYVQLSKECRKRGMKLIMDMVLNHCGSAHWWMKDLPTHDWIHQFPEFTRSNYRISLNNDPYTSTVDSLLCLDGWFDSSMPDMNQRNDLLVTYLAQNSIWWVEYADLGGIRIDTWPYNDKQGAARWAKAVMDEYPNFSLVSECWVSTPSEEAYWQAGAKNYDGYNSHVNTVMDFPLTGDFVPALREDGDLNRFHNHFASDYLYADPYKMLVFFNNHDGSQLASVINSDVAMYKVIMGLMFTTRGIPQIYEGTEIMLPGDKSQGDGLMRKDFPGGWQGDGRDAFTASGRSNIENEMFNFTSLLLNYRKTHEVLQTGKLRHFIPENNTYVYFRYNAQQTIMVVINKNRNEYKMPCKRYSEMLSKFNSAQNIVTGNVVNKLDELVLPPMSITILDLKK